MSAPVQKPATYDDILALPLGVTGQLIDGELYAHPRPATPHALVSSALGGELFGPFQRGRGGPGGWWIIDEPELHLGRQVLVPDLAGCRKERLPVWPHTPALMLAPDWVCEVLSPSTASLDRVKKRRVYEANQVGFLWYLDPIGRTLEAYEWRAQAYHPLGTWGPGEVPRVAPFAELALELDAVWGTAEPAP